MREHRIRYALLVFFVTAIAYLVAPVEQSLDSRWSILQAFSLIHSRDTDLDEFTFLDFEGREKRLATFTIKNVHDRRESFFPLLPAVLAVPTVIVAEWRLCGESPNDCVQKLWKHKSHLEHITAAILTAVTVSSLSFCIFTLCSFPSAIILSCALAFGSSCFSIFSRGLWQQTASCFFEALSLLALCLALDKPSKHWWTLCCGFCCAMAFFCRPTAALYGLAIGSFIIVNRSSYVAFGIGALLGCIPGALLNYEAFGGIFSPYMAAGRIAVTSTWVEALLGNLISPARGLIIFSPWLLIGLKLQGTKINWLRCALFSHCLLHWLLISRFPHWWGGYSYGPRLMSDIIPSLSILCALSIDSFTGRFWRLIIGCAVLTSIVIHTAGATRVDTQYWNTRPSSVDKNPNRLWDYSDPPFLR